MRPLFKVTFYNYICNDYQTAFFNDYAEAYHFAQVEDAPRGVEKNE